MPTLPHLSLLPRHLPRLFSTHYLEPRLFSLTAWATLTGRLAHLTSEHGCEHT